MRIRAFFTFWLSIGLIFPPSLFATGENGKGNGLADTSDFPALLTPPVDVAARPLGPVHASPPAPLIDECPAILAKTAADVEAERAIAQTRLEMAKIAQMTSDAQKCGDKELAACLPIA